MVLSGKKTLKRSLFGLSVHVACSGGVAFLVLACAPPPKVAGHSQTTAPPAPTVGAAAAPPPASPAHPTSPPPTVPAPLASAPGATPSTPAAPAAPPAPSAAAERKLGAPGGFALEAVSSTGKWIAYCQPVGTTAQAPRELRVDERGNPSIPVDLALDVGGARHPIEELLASDLQGRFLVTLEDGVPTLRDAVLGRAYSLGSRAIDLARDALPDHRSVAFSSDGTELALLTNGTEAALSILDLSAPDPTATVRTVPLAGARVWRIAAEGSTFVLTSATPTAKGPGWPVRSWSEPSLRCTQGTFDAFTRLSGPLRDPTLSTALVPHGRALPEPAPGFVMAVGSGWVRRDDDGRLLVVQGKQQRQLASARCGGRILGADAPTGWFLVACEGYRPVKQPDPKPSSKKRPPPPKVRFPLYLLKPGVVRDLDLELMRVGVDIPPIPGQRFLAVRAEPGLLLVDFGKGRAELLPSADRVLLTTETDVLLSSGGRLMRWSGGQRTEVGRIRELDVVLTGTESLAVGSTVYSRGATGFQATALPRAPIALTGGFALVPAKEATVSRWATGPVELIRLTAAEALPEEKPVDGAAGLVAGR